MAITNLYGLASGHITVAAFDANTDYLFKNWQSLSSSELPWMPSTENLVGYPQRVRMGNGHVKDLGSILISPWTLVLTTTMCQYLDTTIFSGGDPSANVTVRTYDQVAGSWKTFNAIAIRPPLKVDTGLTPVANNAFLTYQLEFVDAEVAAAS